MTCTWKVISVPVKCGLKKIYDGVQEGGYYYTEETNNYVRHNNIAKNSITPNTYNQSNNNKTHMLMSHSKNKFTLYFDRTYLQNRFLYEKYIFALSP